MTENADTSAAPLEERVDLKVDQFLGGVLTDLEKSGFSISFNSESSESSESSETSETSETSESSEFAQLEKYLRASDPDPMAWGAILRTAAPVLEKLRQQSATAPE